MWRRGWCRNPRLYSPQQSHLVEQDSLDCARGLGDSWQPGDIAGARSASAKGERRPPLVFGPQPRLAGALVGIGAGAGIMASTNLGGGSGSGGSSGGGGTSPPGGGPPRPERGLPPAGQERTISFQPEERYWTDYLRILLPVAGLLLLIGLLWWWLDFLVGDPTAQAPAPTTSVGAVTTETIEPPISTPRAAGTPADIAANVGPPPTPIPTEAAPQAIDQTPVETAATQTPTLAETPLPDGQESPYATYAIGDAVIVSEPDGANLRQEASVESNSLGVLAQGSQLSIRDNFVPFDPPELDWWPVSSSDGREGFIREDFLEAAPST